MVLLSSVRIPRVPTYSGCGALLLRFRVRGCYPLRPVFPGRSANYFSRSAVPKPLIYFYIKFGLFRFRSPLLSESLFNFLFLRVIRWFSSPGSPRITIDSLYDNAILLALSFLIRISAATIAHLQLTAAFRSLSRPSSAPCTKASSIRSL